MSSEILKINIELNPTTKKNSQKILRNNKTGSLFIAPSDAFRRYQRDAGWYIHCKGAALEGPLEIKCIFYRKNRTRCDLTNLLEAIDDILVHYKVINDDDFNTIVSHDGSRVFIDKDHPRTEVTIRRI